MFFIEPRNIPNKLISTRGTKMSCKNKCLFPRGRFYKYLNYSVVFQRKCYVMAIYDISTNIKDKTVCDKYFEHFIQKILLLL